MKVNRQTERHRQTDRTPDRPTEQSLTLSIPCRVCEPVSKSLSLVSTSNVMLLSLRMTQGNKNFRGHFQAIAEESKTDSLTMILYY